MAGCPWCAARDAYDTYRAVLDAWFPRREGEGRDRLQGANMWLRELSLETRSYYTEDGVPRNGFLEAVVDRRDRDGPLNRAEEYRRLDRFRCGVFGFFERILPLHHALPAAWTLRFRQILLLPEWQDLPPSPGFAVTSFQSPIADPSRGTLLRAVAWAHRYNCQFLGGSPYHLLELGEVRSHGTLQMTAGMFRRREDRLRPRAMPPQPRQRGRGHPRKDRWDDQGVYE